MAGFSIRVSIGLENHGMDKMPSIPLERQVISIMASNREKSLGTQRKRVSELRAAAHVLKERYGLQKWTNLKSKHVNHLVDKWKADDNGRRTIDQKLSHMRWMLGKIGKPNLLPRTNTELGIQPGPRYTRAGKAFPEQKLQTAIRTLKDPRIQAMVRLARDLGLRFEEAALFRPWKDWQGGRVQIKRGTKGGRPRYLNIHNIQQVKALKMARSVTQKDGSLIPPEAPTLEKWRQHVYRKLRAVGISKQEDTTFHDLRRTYAIERVRFLTDQKRMSRNQAAVLVSHEMGHNRTEILNWYLGK